MKYIRMFFLPPAIIFFALLASLVALGRVEYTAGSKKTLARTASEPLNKEAIMTKASSLAVPFVRNAGRFDKEVQYSADLFSGRFFLTDKELVYSLMQRTKINNARQDKSRVFKEYFVDEKGGRISFEPTGEEKGTTKISYFRGNDPAKWQSGLASYHLVSLGQVYPGIGVKLKASGKNVEKIFYVSPRADVSKIKIGVAGLKGLKITKDGRLLFENAKGDLAMRAPVAWQEIEGRRREVKVSYCISEKKFYGFLIKSEHDINQPLIIDPALDTLMASTLFGGGSSNYASSLVLDSLGNVYLAGDTDSPDFPTTIGAYDRKINPEVYGDPPSWYHGYPEDIFVSKFNGDLTKLLASTFLGGDEGDWWDSPDDSALSLALDSAGNVLVSGVTKSPDFPTTQGAYDRSYSDYGDAFVARLDANLSKLLASTLLGGGGMESGGFMALDGTGNIYVTGTTTSLDFPTTQGAYDPSANDGHWYGDVFISRMDCDLTTLLASTYLGGTDKDEGCSLALDRAGNVFVCGTTESPDFPTTPGANDRTYNGGSANGTGDAFISKLDGKLTTLLASTYLGGKGDDKSGCLAVGRSGIVYLAGNTNSADFPTSAGAYDPTYNGADSSPSFYHGDAFVSRLDNDLARVLSSTYLGGRNNDGGSSLALDMTGNVYLTGATSSSGFPTTPGAYDRTYNGVFDAFVSKLDGNLATLLLSSYLGGSDWDSGRSIAFDGRGDICLIGSTRSNDFPTTPGAYDREHHGVFISKLNGNRNGVAVTSPNGGESWVAGTVHDVTWTSSGKITEVRIELSLDNGSSWSEVSVSPARYHRFSWTVANSPSRQCLVRISDADNAGISDTSDAMFSILMNIDLVAERREARAFSIVRQYGRIQFLIGNVSVQVAQHRLMRRKNGEDFALLKEIAPSQLQNDQYQMQDKYLEKGATYTYRVDAYDAAGQMIGISAEKTI